MGEPNLQRQDLASILARIRQKKENYVLYNFSTPQNDLLRTFFDLAQEYDTLEDFYRICVGILYEFMGLESRLYLLDESEQHLQLVCESTSGVLKYSSPLPPDIRIAEQPYVTGDSYLLPIHKKPALSKDHHIPLLKSQVMGMLAVSPVANLTSADLFFLGKYTNRIGYNLYNRIIAHQNINHLRFINNLVMDIEHNVIIPNMYFKHLFNQLKKSIAEMGVLEAFVKEMKESQNQMGKKCDFVVNKIVEVHQKLAESHRQIEEYHANTSLFLESLFRRDHFEQGHLVLRPKLCNIEEEIILPQLEQYEKRLAGRGITIEKPRDMIGEAILLNVDVGLLAQVYANLFSNAVKYTEEITDQNGNPRKAMAYGRQIIRNYFDIGSDAIKCNVFTTGKHLSVSESEAAFSDGFRGENSKALPGTGHGLSFIKQVIEMHGGLVGYEPTSQGNNFYFILPIPEQESSSIKSM